MEQKMNTENKPELADVFSRIVANIIDSIIQTVLILIIVAIAMIFKQGWLLVLAWVILLISPIYFIFFETRNGQTPGKKIANIKVVDRELRDISFIKALLRNVTKFIPLWTVVGTLLIALTEKRQRLGDMLAGTLVIKMKQ